MILILSISDAHYQGQPQRSTRKLLHLEKVNGLLTLVHWVSLMIQTSTPWPGQPWRPHQFAVSVCHPHTLPHASSPRTEKTSFVAPWFAWFKYFHLNLWRRKGLTKHSHITYINYWLARVLDRTSLFTPESAAVVPHGWCPSWQTVTQSSWPLWFS